MRSNIRLLNDVCNGNEPVPIPLFTESGTDHDAVLDPGFRYSSSLVLPDGISDSDASTGCSCSEKCGETGIECDCIDEHGKTFNSTHGARADVFRAGFFFDEGGCLNLEAIPPSFALYECGPACACAGQCRNAVVQKGVQVLCEVRQTTGRGLGLFAKQPLRKGSFLCIYAGEIISTKKARERWAHQKATGAGNYVLVINEHIIAGGRQETLKTTVDPTFVGNIGRFMSRRTYFFAGLY